MVFNLDEPNENYEEDLSKEAEDIINTLNPWKVDEWVAVLYNSSWYPGAITEVLLIHYFQCGYKSWCMLTLKQYMSF